jgi:hypothetical protein
LVVLLSSRCATPVRAARGGPVPLTAVRVRAKNEIEQLLAYGNRRSAFEVWINEPSEATPADDNWFDESIERAERADLVIALFSGDPGSILAGRGVGVCHAELVAAYKDAPSKVRIVDVTGALVERPEPTDPQAWASFAEAVERLQTIESRPGDADEIVEATKEAVAAATHQLALFGRAAARRGSKSLGAALDWRRLSFRERKRQMEQVVLAELSRGGGGVDEERRLATLPLQDAEVLLVVNAAPDGLALASSRELVGQPHRDDHLLVAQLHEGKIGPVHLVVVPGNATVAQARSMIGATDVMVAQFPAGVWVADTVARAQALVVGQCADESTTRQQVDAALSWLTQSGEAVLLLQRARRRAAIVTEMARADEGEATS